MSLTKPNKAYSFDSIGGVDFSSPSGVDAIDGMIAVCDSTRLVLFEIMDVSNYYSVSEIAVDCRFKKLHGQTYLYVLYANGDVKVFNQVLTELKTYSLGLTSARAFDHSHTHWFITSGSDDMIYKYDLGFTLVTSAGGNGSGNDEFETINQVTIDRDRERLFVVDADEVTPQRRVSVWDGSDMSQVDILTEPTLGDLTGIRGVAYLYDMIYITLSTTVVAYDSSALTLLKTSDAAEVNAGEYIKAATPNVASPDRLLILTDQDGVHVLMRSIPEVDDFAISIGGSDPDFDGTQAGNPIGYGNIPIGGRQMTKKHKATGAVKWSKKH